MQEINTNTNTNTTEITKLSTIIAGYKGFNDEILYKAGASYYEKLLVCLKNKLLKNHGVLPLAIFDAKKYHDYIFNNALGVNGGLGNCNSGNGNLNLLYADMLYKLSYHVLNAQKVLWRLLNENKEEPKAQEVKDELLALKQQLQTLKDYITNQGKKQKESATNPKEMLNVFSDVILSIKNIYEEFSLVDQPKEAKEVNKLKKIKKVKKVINKKPSFSQTGKVPGEVVGSSIFLSKNTGNNFLAGGGQYFLTFNKNIGYISKYKTIEQNLKINLKIKITKEFKEMIKPKKFELVSKYAPSGDQPKAIEALVKGINAGKKDQVLLGVTGSGKTFTMANIIAQTQRPTIIMAHNKTLAAQLYSEFKSFFPNNAVEYFISFFDYYQPEAYLPSSDVFIDKDSVINSKIEQMKHSAIYSLLERKDVIVIASVSCIYGIGEKSFYEQLKMNLEVGQVISISNLALNLVGLQYVRNDLAFERATFRIKGDIVEIFPAHLDEFALRLSFFGDEIESINLIDPLTGKKLESLTSFRIYSATLYATPKDVISTAIPKIRAEMQERVEYFKSHEKHIEAQRIAERTNFDAEMLQATGYCKGIENYTRYLSGKEAGSTPSTMFDYLPEDVLVFVDESHVSVPQVRGMYNGDKNRKEVLVSYGFRLPSCLDNRPLKFDEWEGKRRQTLFISATPGEFELTQTGGEVIEQIIRPTGLLDPICIVRPVENQMEDLMQEIKKILPKKEKVLAITLTKKMAEQITDYFNENGIRAKYLHSDIDSLERVQIIKSLRLDEFDVLVGINLLREGLDIPECSLVAILDADKEGFLRSKTSLVQTIGRAARNSEGRVILYADKMTASLDYAISETNRRRAIQEEYNKQNGITPQTVFSKIIEIDIEEKANGFDKKKIKGKNGGNDDKEFRFLDSADLGKLKVKLEKEMNQAADNLEFEKAIEIREKIKKIESLMLDVI
jgi:excinuclease ABC subunit B